MSENVSNKIRIERANTCLKVLRTVGEYGKSSLPRALCTYQVLHFHPLREELITKYGLPGKGGGSQSNSSSHWVMRGLMLLARYGLVEYHYVTSKATAYIVGDFVIVPSYPVLAYYQLTSTGILVDHLDLIDGKVVLMNSDGKPFREFSSEYVDEDRVED